MSDECSNQVKMCKLDISKCKYEGYERDCPFHKKECISPDNRVPTFSEWIEIFSDLSEKRNLKTVMLDKPRRKQIVNTLIQFVETMNYSMNDKVTLITRRSIYDFINKISGLKNTSLKSKAQTIQAAFARWIRFEVEDDWDVPKFDIPEIKDDADRFHTPSPEQMVKFSVWYRSLLVRGHGHRKGKARVLVTLMLHYALRNGDTTRMKWKNITIVDGKPLLEYIPHKTRLTSKRKVRIWMDRLDYHDFMEYRELQKKYGYPCGDDDFILGGGKCIELMSKLNSEIAQLGFNCGKRLYICRKLCCDAVLKEYSKEMAEAVSGDSYNTITKSYSDISSMDSFVPKSLIF